MRVYLAAAVAFLAGAASLASPAGRAKDAEIAIDRIIVERLPVFPDTGATPLPLPLRLANRLHWTTAEAVIRREIVFREGSPLDSFALSDSERLLRERGLFESAEIQPLPSDSGRTVLIRTQDIWTLAVVLAFEMQADLSSLTVGLRESNLFGTGNAIGWTQTFSTDQDGTVAAASFPRLGRSRAAAAAVYADQEDASVRSASIGKLPDTSFERWGWGLAFRAARSRQRFFHRGEEIGVSRYREQAASLFAGRYSGTATQVAYGVGWIERETQPRSRPTRHPAYPAPPSFEERLHGGPFVYGGVMRRRFLEGLNLDRYGTVEDLPRGFSLFLVAGPNRRHEEEPSHSFAMRTAAVGSMRLRNGVMASIEASAVLFVRADRSIGERRVLTAASLAWQPADHVVTVLQAIALASASRPATAVVNLGTESGLRGFPSREFETRDYILATLEQRFWSGREILWTGIGASLFADTALPSHRGLNDGEAWRTGIGCGLLLGLRKSLRSPLRIEAAWRTDEPSHPTLSISMTTRIRIAPSMAFPHPSSRFAESGR